MIAAARPDIVVFQEATVPAVVERLAQRTGMAQWATTRGESLGFMSREKVRHYEWHHPRFSRHAFLEIEPGAGNMRIFGVHLSALYSAWTERHRVIELRALLAAIAQPPARSPRAHRRFQHPRPGRPARFPEAPAPAARPRLAERRPDPVADDPDRPRRRLHRRLSRAERRRSRLHIPDLGAARAPRLHVRSVRVRRPRQRVRDSSITRLRPPLRIIFRFSRSSKVNPAARAKRAPLPANEVSRPLRRAKRAAPTEARRAEALRRAKRAAPYRGPQGRGPTVAPRNRLHSRPELA